MEKVISVSSRYEKITIVTEEGVVIAQLTPDWLDLYKEIPKVSFKPYEQK